MTRVSSLNGSPLVLRENHDPVVCTVSGAAGHAPSRTFSYCPCFTPGTLIKTDRGEITAENIAPGHRVLTRDNGYQQVVWAGARTLGPKVLRNHPELLPIKLSRGALGPDLPERDTLVSPQHRMLLSNGQIRRWFESDEVLVAAHLLTCFEGIERVSVEEVSYIHFMFEQHEIVLADGAWSESYQPQDMRAGAMHEAHRKELLAIFPALAEEADEPLPAARPEVGSEQFNRSVFFGK